MLSYSGVGPALHTTVPLDLSSTDGSREYVNVSQELQPVTGAELDTMKSQVVEDEGEEEGVEGEEAPDYENLQELN
ncbi:linker for activation of T cells [Cricetulus griseus]